MANFKINESLDASTVLASFIPPGAIIQKALSPTLAGSLSTNYSTNAQVLDAGIIPCDGRSLNTYTFRNLHKAISNTYGGTAYSAGVTDISSASTTFNIPDLRTAKRYIAGIASPSTTVPSLSANVTNSASNHTHSSVGSVTTLLSTISSGSTNHTHADSTFTTPNHAVANTGSHNTHSIQVTYSGTATSYVNNANYNYNNNVKKNDGNSNGSAAGHNHTVSISFSRRASGDAVWNTDATHSATVSYSASDGGAHQHVATHNTTVNSTGISPTSDPISIDMLYFIKI